ITNPTKRSLFISCGLKDYEIKAGQTVKGILSGTYVEPSKDTESKTAPSSSSKKANTASKDKASKVDKTSKVDTSSEEIVEVVESEIIIDDTKQESNDIMQYLWILIAVAAVVVIALLVVIFLPKFKKTPKE
ncbi:MAG: hypothetical protein J6I80_02280, partial [Clostridia bacterium]|nr:hypothetical protein [Clostridia bacterium]